MAETLNAAPEFFPRHPSHFLCGCHESYALVQKSMGPKAPNKGRQRCSSQFPTAQCQFEAHHLTINQLNLVQLWYLGFIFDVHKQSHCVRHYLVNLKW
jgi:hypothetical protein